MTINSLIHPVRPTGRIGIVGVFVPQDPNASDDLAKESKFGFDFGTFSSNAKPWGTGQCNTKQDNRQLRNLIHRDKIHPGMIVSHELNLNEAAEATKTSTTGSRCGPRPTVSQRRPAPPSHGLPCGSRVD